MGYVDFRAGARVITNEENRPAVFKQLNPLWADQQVRALAFPTRLNNDELGQIHDMRVSFFPNYALGHLQAGIEPGVKKIAVLRSNAIGDFVFVMPALHALRMAYPEAEIVLLGLEWHARFLENRPGPVDRVIVVPHSRGVREPEDYVEDSAEMEEFFRRMTAERFDIALQMHGGGRHSNPFVRRLGARLTAGSRTPDAEPLDRWVPYVFYQLEVLRYLEVVSLVGATMTVLEPHISVTASDLAEAQPFLPVDGAPLVVLHPGAGDRRRRWPVEKFIAVGNSLIWAGARVAVSGSGDEESALAENICQGLADGAINVSGKLSINGLAGLLSQAAVVVSNDSGPLHLAAAVGAPTVGIYWVGNLITAGPISRSFHRPAISWRLDCPVCGLDCTRNNCGHAVSFVADVSQEEVTASALELLSLVRQYGRNESMPVQMHEIGSD